MTKDRYFELMAQMGQEPDIDEMPADWEDIPPLAQSAVLTFNSLGDRVYPEIGYVGKDYTLIDKYIGIHGINPKDEEYFLDILQTLDARAIKQSSDQIKREYDKIKRKSNR